MIEYIKSEPVRVRLYSIIILIAGYLLVKGIVSPDDATFIVAMAAAILGVETARAKVSPREKYAPKHRA